MGSPTVVSVQERQEFLWKTDEYLANYAVLRYQGGLHRSSCNQSVWLDAVTASIIFIPTAPTSSLVGLPLVRSRWGAISTWFHGFSYLVCLPAAAQHQGQRDSVLGRHSNL